MKNGTRFLAILRQVLERNITFEKELFISLVHGQSLVFDLETDKDEFIQLWNVDLEQE